MAGRDIRRTRINKLTIHFIGEEEQIVLLHKVTYLVHFATGIKITCRIIRITDQDSPGALVNQLFKLFYFRKRKTFFYGSGNGAYLSTGRDGKRHIVSVSRFGNNNLVTRIEARQEGEQYRLRTTGRNDDIICRQFDVELIIIAHQLLTVTTISCTGTIFQNFPVDIAYRINRDLRRGQIGLSDVQVEYMHSPLLGCVSQRSQFSDRRRGHLRSANRYCWHV